MNSHTLPQNQAGLPRARVGARVPCGRTDPFVAGDSLLAPRSSSLLLHLLLLLLHLHPLHPLLPLLRRTNRTAFTGEESAKSKHLTARASSRRVR